MQSTVDSHCGHFIGCFKMPYYLLTIQMFNKNRRKYYQKTTKNELSPSWWSISQFRLVFVQTDTFTDRNNFLGKQIVFLFLLKQTTPKEQINSSRHFSRTADFFSPNIKFNISHNTDKTLKFTSCRMFSQKSD